MARKKKQGQAEVESVHKIRKITNLSVLETLRGSYDAYRNITFVFYGRPVTGKSLLLCYEAAQIVSRYGGKIRVYAADPTYWIPTNREKIENIFKAYGVEYEIVEEDNGDKIIRDLRSSFDNPQWKVVIVDSFATIQVEAENLMGMWMRKGPAATKQVSSILKRLAQTMSKYAKKANGWAFAITAATPVIMSDYYRGISPYKPSYSEQTLHFAGGLIWISEPEYIPSTARRKALETLQKLQDKIKDADCIDFEVVKSYEEKDLRMAVNVVDRVASPGNAVVFTFAPCKRDGSTIPVPVPLVEVKFKVEQAW